MSREVPIADAETWRQAYVKAEREIASLRERLAQAEERAKGVERTHGLLLTGLACESGGALMLTDRAILAHEHPTFTLIRDEMRRATTILATCSHCAIRDSSLKQPVTDAEEAQ